MKKTVVLFFVICLTCICAFTHDVEKGYISVDASSTTEVMPDIAEINFTVKTFDAKSIQKASEMNREISAKVIQKLKTYINADTDYIKTTDFKAVPQYTYKDSKNVLQGYEVSNSLIVKTKSLDKIGGLIDSAIAEGATNVSNLNFSLSNYDLQCNKLLVDATQKAKNKAEIVSKILKTEIDKVRTLDTSCHTSSNNSTRLYMAKNMLSETADSLNGHSTTVENGVIKINANVNATFYVK